ncbi:MAG: hypothetical protein M3O00_17730 [Pseudomonadota bacterium]|nr:hypothetical protein [Pseudomonadota bacterium]
MPIHDLVQVRQPVGGTERATALALDCALNIMAEPFQQPHEPVDHCCAALTDRIADAPQDHWRAQVEIHGQPNDYGAGAKDPRGSRRPAKGEWASHVLNRSLLLFSFIAAC